MNDNQVIQQANAEIELIKQVVGQSTLYNDLVNNFQLTKDQIHTYQTDIHILPSDLEQTQAITKYLKKLKFCYQFCKSDVKGQSWYGKTFIDIPFGNFDADKHK